MKLWPYQQKAVELVHAKKKMYLALAPGMGKTLTSLAAALAVTERVLVVAELNEVENSENFKKEVLNHFPGVEYFSLRKVKINKLPYRGRYVAAVNPDMLKKFDLEDLALKFGALIVDEATMAKNAGSARFKFVHAVAHAMPYVILLSGTPMMNGAAEIYAPLLLLDHQISGLPDEKGTYAKAQQDFETIFAAGHKQRIRYSGNPFKDYIWVAKDARFVRELRYLINENFFVLRKEDTKGVFKKKLRRVEYASMSLEWLAEYNQAWNEYVGTLKGRFGDLTEKQFAKKLSNITELQRLIENSKIAQINSQWKARRVVEDIKAGKYGDRRIVVFSTFIETDKLLADLLTQEGISFRTFEEINEWKANGERVLVGRIKAHGKGTNVPEASVALFVDMSWVPNENLQAECRIDRPEQTRNMEIVYYITENETVDEHIREINKKKQERITEFMRPFTSEEMTMLPSQLAELRSAFPKECASLGI